VAAAVREPPEETRMKRLNVVELKNSLGDVLNRAEYQGERIIVHRRGKDSAAIISIDDLRLFERLLEEAEDRLDVAAARAALAESEERIPYEEFRRRQGLSDEPTPKKQQAGAKAGTEAV
jgi:prevent-host-death family protein